MNAEGTTLGDDVREHLEQNWNNENVQRLIKLTRIEVYEHSSY
jgi:hypothetical protein